MKRYIILSILVLAFGSCTDFLDVSTEKSPTEKTYLNTDAEVTAAMNAVYAGGIFTEDDACFGRGFFYEWAGGGDDMIFGRTRGDLFYHLCNFDYTGDDGNTVLDAWRGINNNIAKANWLIYNLLKKGELTPVQSHRLGEAYFFRAFCHFYIAYRYGRADNGVPFDRYEDYDPYEYGIPVQRATVMENYDLIIQDLEKAADLVSYFEEYAPDDQGRAHKAACWAYMVKVYAYWAQYDETKWDLIPPLVDKIETEGKRGLLDNFADVFTIANNWSKEYIWSIVSSVETNRGCRLPGVTLENHAWGLVNGWGFFKPTLGLYNEYAQNDTRLKATIWEYGDEIVMYGLKMRFFSTSDLESGFQLAKYMDGYKYGEVVNGAGVGGPKEVITDLNVPIVRFAEMVLYKAEALIMRGKGAEGATVLNRISSRAGLGNLYTNATMDDLKHERRCELAGELSDRFMDLKRWKEWTILDAPKYGRHYEDRGDPDSTWEPIEIWPARHFEPEYDIVMPYHPDEVVRANGKLKQNPIGGR